MKKTKSKTLKSAIMKTFKILFITIMVITSCTNDSYIHQIPEENNISFKEQINKLVQKYDVEEYIKINENLIQKIQATPKSLVSVEKFIKSVANLHNQGEIIIKSQKSIPQTRFWYDSWIGEAISNDFQLTILVSWISDDVVPDNIKLADVDVIVSAPGNVYFEKLTNIPEEFFNPSTNILEYRTLGMLYEPFEGEIILYAYADISGWVNVANHEGEARAFCYH